MDVTDIHIVGAGGIGSFLCRELGRLRKARQLPNSSVTVWDDGLVEPGNVIYQDFDEGQIFAPKVEVLAKRYGLVGQKQRVEDFDMPELNDATLIVLCVDNAETRRRFYSSNRARNTPWIDLRSQGKATVYFCSSEKNTCETMLAGIPLTQEPGTFSCQYTEDLRAGRIENGNVIIAAVGAQQVLNLVRKDEYTSSFVHDF